MLETELNSDFDGIIGCNILRPLQAKVDFELSQLITNETTLPLIFCNSQTQLSQEEVRNLSKALTEICLKNRT